MPRDPIVLKGFDFLLKQLTTPQRWDIHLGTSLRGRRITKKVHWPGVDHLLFHSVSDDVCSNIMDRGKGKYDVTLRDYMIPLLIPKLLQTQVEHDILSGLHVKWHVFYTLPGAKDQPFHQDEGTSKPEDYQTLQIPLTKDPAAAGFTEFQDEKEEFNRPQPLGHGILFHGQEIHRGRGNTTSNHTRIFLYAVGFKGIQDANDI